MAGFTRLLQQFADGAVDADATAITALYEEVRRLARSFLRNERAGHTLVPTALANEAWLRLFGVDRPQFAGGAQFFAAAATTLRRILVEHARRRAAQRRGGERERLEIDPAELAAPRREARLLELDAALERLAACDPAQARLVELRFFAGLTVDETARVLDLSPRTVARDWQLARAFLRLELQQAGIGDEVPD